MNQQSVDSTERALERAARGGDREARNCLITTHIGTIRELVKRKVPIEDVDDLTQEVAFAAMKSLPSFLGTGSFQAWLRILVRREIADYHYARGLIHRSALPIALKRTFWMPESKRPLRRLRVGWMPR